MRSYNELANDIIHSIPFREEVDALTAEQIESLRKLGNTFDNVLYLAILRREKQS